MIRTQVKVRSCPIRTRMSCKYNGTESSHSSVGEKKLTLYFHHFYSVIDDEEADIAMAIEQLKSPKNEATETTETPEPKIENTNDAPLPQYNVRNEAVFKFPRMLLDRILANKQLIKELEGTAAQLKKQCYQMSKDYRLQHATTSNETIDIS